VNEIGGTRSTRGKYVQIFGRKTWRNETSCKTLYTRKDNI
jgi:hypothetical protein